MIKPKYNFVDMIHMGFAIIGKISKIKLNKYMIHMKLPNNMKNKQ